MSRASRVLSLARNRRPVRQFADRPVPAHLLECVLECGRFAPSAKEDQPWRFIVVREALTRHRLAALAFNHPHVRSAPVLVICCARFYSHVSGTGRPSYPMDLTAAAQNMMLAAADLGLAFSWITGFREAGVRDLLEIPAGIPVVSILAFGFPDGLSDLAPRRDLSEAIAWERWSEDAEVPGRA